MSDDHTDPRQPTFEEMRARMPTSSGKYKGLYAAPPGTGPAGRTCGTCDNLLYTHHTKAKHPKCGLTEYTHGDATTILTRTPACEHYVARHALTRPTRIT